MRLRYKGQHKGSTVKARSKNALFYAFNFFLVFVLVVGVAPHVSWAEIFGNDDSTFSEVSDIQDSEQASGEENDAEQDFESAADADADSDEQTAANGTQSDASAGVEDSDEVQSDDGEGEAPDASGSTDAANDAVSGLADSSQSSAAGTDAGSSTSYDSIGYAEYDDDEYDVDADADDEDDEDYDTTDTTTSKRNSIRKSSSANDTESESYEDSTTIIQQRVKSQLRAISTQEIGENAKVTFTYNSKTVEDGSLFLSTKDAARTITIGYAGCTVNDVDVYLDDKKQTEKTKVTFDANTTESTHTIKVVQESAEVTTDEIPGGLLTVKIDNAPPVLEAENVFGSASAISYDAEKKIAYLNLPGSDQATLTLTASDGSSGTSSGLDFATENATSLKISGLNEDRSVRFDSDTGTATATFSANDFYPDGATELKTASVVVKLTDKAGNSSEYYLQNDNLTLKPLLHNEESQDNIFFTAENAQLAKEITVGDLTLGTGEGSEEKKIATLSNNATYAGYDVTFDISDSKNLLDTTKFDKYPNSDKLSISNWENNKATVTVAGTNGEVVPYNSAKVTLTSNHGTTLDITKSFTIDEKAPEIKVTYGDSSTNLSTGESVNIGPGTSVTVSVTDPCFSANDTTVKLNDKEYTVSEWSTEDDVHSATVTLNQSSGDVTTNTITVDSADAVGNASTQYAGTLVVDYKAPEIQVAWNPNDGAKKYDDVDYYAPRTATITVTDDSFDEASIENDLQISAYVGGEVQKTGDKVWTKDDDNKYTATVEYKDDHEDCTLTVKAEDIFENKYKTGESEGLSVGPFTTVAHPVINVTMNPETADEADHAFYALDPTTNKLTATLTVWDPLFDPSASGVSVTDALLDSTDLKWVQPDATKPIWTASVTYSKPGKANLIVDTSTSKREYAGAGTGTTLYPAVTGGITLDASHQYSHNFTIDNVKPVLVSVDYTETPGPGVSAESKTIYFNKTTKATVTVTEANLRSADGSPITVNVNDGTTDHSYTLTASGSTWTNANDIEFAKPSSAGTNTYTFTIEGTDLAGNALVVDDNATGLRTYFDSNNSCYTATIVVENEPPTLSVTYDNGTSLDNVRYSSEDVTATIIVADTHLDAGNVNATVKNETSGEVTSKPIPGDGKLKIPLTAGPATTVPYTLTIEGTDAAGNALTPENTTIECSTGYYNGGMYEGKITINKIAPKLDVSFNPYSSTRLEAGATPFTFESASGTTPPTYYYNKSVTVDGNVNDDAKGMINAGGVTAKVTPPSGAAVTTPSPKGAAFTNVFGGSAYSITAAADGSNDGTYTFEVAGSDVAGNALAPASGSSRESEGMTGAAGYKANVVMDTELPTVAVSYSLGGTNTEIAYGSHADKNSAIILGSAPTVNMQFSDGASSGFNNFKYDGAYITVKVNGTQITDPKKLQVGTSGVTLSLAELNGSALTQVVEIDAYDKAGNQLAAAGGNTANKFVAYFVVDQKVPELSVSVDPFSKGSTPRTATTINGTPTYYYNTNVTVNGSVTDESRIDAKGINAKVTPAKGAATTKSSTQDTSFVDIFGAGGYTCTANEANNGTYTFEVYGSTAGASAKDHAGNTMIAKTSSARAVEGVSNGVYKAQVIMDTVAPAITVTWDNDDVRNSRYYNANRTATVTVVEPNYNMDDFVITTTNGSIGSWSTNGATHTATVKFLQEGDCSLKVTGIDLAGNNMTTFNSGTFTIDKTEPKVSANIDRAVDASKGSTNYFGTTVKATITVVDEHFNEEGKTDHKSTVNARGVITNESGWGKSKKYTITFGENTEETPTSTVSATIYDLAGNQVKYTYGTNTTANKVSLPEGSKRLTVDMTAPDLSLVKALTSYSTTYGSASNPAVFYKDKSSAGLSIVINDAIGISEASIAEPFQLTGENKNVGTHATKSIFLLQGDTVQTRDKYNQTMSSPFITLKDDTGNWRTWCITADGQVYLVKGGQASGAQNIAIDLLKGETLHPSAMVLDNIAPVLDWTSAPAADSYSNQTQNATLHITEMNLDYLQRYESGRIVITQTTAAGEAGRAQSTKTIPVSEFNGGGSSWDHTMTFDTDGHYSMEAELEDIAGNMSNRATVQEFTIDKTAPTVEVSWDNNNARNGMYYNSSRTATITIHEHNFEAGGFNVETTGSVGGWSDNGDTHTCTVSYATDGRYTLTISGHDKAGNVLATHTESEFVIDLRNPTITFANVEEDTAYNGLIAPSIIYTDEANLDSNGLTYTLTGNKNGTQSFEAGQSVSGESATISYSNFPDQVESDDIYTLSAQMTDMAGNQAENSITFSVNRYGSNFIVKDKDVFEENNGVIPEAREIVVQEINVCGADSSQHDVTVTHDLTTENLEQKQSGTEDSEGFYIRSGAESYGWSSYEYHIGSGNFKDEGNYHVVVNSTDLAENLNTSSSYYNPDEHKTTDAEVSFILDNQDPIIDSLNVASGGVYDAANFAITFMVTDNIGFDNVAVTIDGVTREIEPELGGMCTIPVDGDFLKAAAFTPRTIEIVATDLATRTATEIVDNLHITDNAFELHMPVAVGGGVVVVAGVAAGTVFFIRRRPGA